jgi:hypothetical protein
MDGVGVASTVSFKLALSTASVIDNEGRIIFVPLADAADRVNMRSRMEVKNVGADVLDDVAGVMALRGAEWL